MPHIPVLLKEVIEILNPEGSRQGGTYGAGPQPVKFFIDGTIGSGGYAVEILKRIGPRGKLLGIDWDKNAIERLKIGKLKDYKNAILINGNYANLPEILEKIRKADPSIPLRTSGLIIDLGFSSEQLESGIGFSFQKDEPLDMRYSREISNEKGEIKNLTAVEIINSFPEKELADIFYKYGEERYSRRIAKAITEERKKRPIKTTFDLVNIILKCQWSNVRGQRSKFRIHPATRVFQALRIYINKELENLETLLKNLAEIMKRGAAGSDISNRPAEISPPASSQNINKDKGRNLEGRAAIISYHSLEDRLVKNYFKDLERQKAAKILTKKPVRPSKEEIRQNPRSRSAKLRALLIY